MKQNRLSKPIRACRGRARPIRMAARTTLAVTFVLALLSVTLSFAHEAGETNISSKTEAMQVSDTKKEVVKEQTLLKVKPAAPEDGDAAVEIKPVGLEEAPLLSAPAIRDKGRQIKWQVLCTGGNCGAGNVTFPVAQLADYHMCGTIGQTSVGPGSSASFGMNSGFWQDFIGGFLRGDANGDGTIGLEDVVYLLNYLFREGPAPIPFEAGNANCDHGVDMEDVVFLINYILRNGPRPSC